MKQVHKHHKAFLFKKTHFNPMEDLETLLHRYRGIMSFLKI